MVNNMQTLKSDLDESVNFITKADRGFTEARYVRRAPHYFIGYLSSQTGCNHGCEFCHLTNTDQKEYRNISTPEFYAQAAQIVKHYKTQPQAKIVNWNFMARGEPLANPYITDSSMRTFSAISNTIEGIIQRFNISTIMPIKFKKPLAEAFPVITPTIYYSIYSIDQAFREKWMPAAQPVEQALENLKDYQDITGKLVKFHCAFIKDQNDDIQDVIKMMDKIQEYEIQGSFNIVRYNPYSDIQGEETSMEQLINIEHHINSYYMPCKIISRVGADIHASCGQFVTE